ncbi:MAG: patatin-like phospholipase family protein [Rhizobiaceae bacterium]
MTAPVAGASPVSTSGGGPTFAVAFGGGGARGLAHIHVIEVLDELGIRPVAISGSSIGAIMGAGMASGMSGAEIHDHARSLLGDGSSLASRMWRLRPTNLRQAVGGLRMTQFNIERILRAMLPPQIPEDFAELKIPLKVTATDFFGHSLVVNEEGDLYTALAASAAIPALFKPIRRDGRLLIDGGIYDPVPYDLLMHLADIVIAIDVVGGPHGRSSRNPNSIDLMLGASQLMMQSIIANKLTRQRPAIFLRPPVSGFRVLDFLKIEAVMRESEPIRDELKQAIDAAVKKVEMAEA